MCDDITERENEAYLSRRKLSLGVAATAALAACGGSGSAEPEAPAEAASEPEPTPEAEGASPTASRRVTIETPDGKADGLFVYLEGDPRPGVLMWPDVAGLRPAYEDMATRLAEDGYAVLVINPYYRSQASPILAEFSEWRTDEGKAKIAPMREKLTPEAIARDAVALVAWLDAQPEVDTAKKVGTQGYCMSGPFTFRVAAAVPDRVGAFASFHGGGLVTEGEDSPHRLLDDMKAAVLICIAENDHERDPEAKPALEEAAKEAGRTAEIEVYPANHGWCALDSPVYDAEQAEKAWARLLATYDAHL